MPTQQHDRRGAQWLIPVLALGPAFVWVSGVIPSTAGYVVIVGVCVFLGYVLRTFVGDPSGLKHHHQ
jgi:hypothetical protein